MCVCVFSFSPYAYILHFSSATESIGCMCVCVCISGIFQVVQVVKNSPASAGDAGLIPGSGRSPGEGNDNPLQYFCLENPMHRGAW